MSGTSDNTNKRERSESETPEQLKPESKIFIMNDGSTTEPDQHDLYSLIKGLSITLTNVQTQITEMRVNVDAKLDQLNNKFADWQNEKAELLQKQTELEERLDRIERQQKRNNIVVTGVAVEAQAQANNVIEQLLKAKLNMNLKVGNAFYIKTKSGANKIIATMNSYEDKNAVMKSKRKLNDVGGPVKIFINDDLIPKDEFIQYQARIFAKKMRDSGKDAKIAFKKVYVNNVAHIWDANSESFINRKN